MDAMHSRGEPRALISRSALVHNAQLLRRTIGDGVKICAILKADAYGHGAEIVADTLCNRPAGPLVDAVAVANLDEAAELPAVPVPVIVFRPVENVFLGRQRQKLEHAIRHGWVLTICSSAAADDVARVAVQCARRASVQIMLDTGMTRSGTDLSAFDAVLATVLAHPSLKLHGLCTHFACADDPGSPFTGEQLARFRQATESSAVLKRLEGKTILRHAANSAAAFFLPESHLDMVRPGLSLYGIDPAGQAALERKLRPAMKWTAPILNVRTIKKGTGVGYGQTWRAEKDSRIGLVAVGYADGYLRAFSNNAVMVVDGRAAPVVGRVSMDLVTIDLSGAPAANVGDEAIVLDDDPLSPASVYELAKAAGTLAYEIFCRIGQRIVRVAVGEEERIEEQRKTV